ncbi:MAG: D-alanyl-D-alanine carboxypeptidase, partial [Methyloceanibacter sp.]
RIPPASMSKLMTLAVVFRELKAGRIKLDDTFTVSEHAWRTGGAPSGTAAMFAPLGSPITVSDLIQGVTVQSANDGALILAEGIGGTEGGFVKMMNDYAKQNGLTGSTFANPTGLPAELKTGYTAEAGYGLVSSAKRGDQRLILVVTGLEGKNDRESESRRVLEWGFKSFRPFRLFEDGQQVSEALVWGGEKHYVPLVGDGAIDLLLPASATGAVTGEIIYEGPIKAPIKKGDQIATLKVQSAELAAINEIPLYAGEDINSSGFAMRGIDSLLVLAFGWLL